MASKTCVNCGKELGALAGKVDVSDIDQYQSEKEASAVQQPHTSVENQSNISVADEILKFKQLMDAGVITEAEFESKKKQLLGL